MVDKESSPTLLFVGGARALPVGIDMAIGALTQARSRGIHTHVTAQTAALAETPSVIELADAVSAVDLDQPGETADWAKRRVAEGERIDAVFGLHEMAQVEAAETAEAVQAPGNPPHAVRCARTKDVCRATLAAAGFAQPAMRLCADSDEVLAFLGESTGPWIVKPRDAMGSVGVSLVSDPADLPAALALLPDSSSFLAEEFVEGPEFSVEGVFLGGVPTILAITAKEKVPPPYFVEVGHVLPAELPEMDRREIERQVSSALTTVGLRTGGFHVELWLTPTGVVLGEVHGRFGGDWIHRMLEHVVPGLELFGLIFDDMLGRANGHGSLKPTRGAAVRYLTPPPGRVTSIEGWEDVLAHPAVLYAELAVAAGDIIHPLQRSGDRVGLVVVGANTSAQAQQLALELSSAVRFTMDPSL
jgi:biotin carboxylase